MILLETLSESYFTISEVILSCLSSWASLFPVLNKCDPEIMQLTFNTLSECLSRLSHKSEFNNPVEISFSQNLLTTMLVH